MTNLKTMYKGKANSPETYLKDKIVAEGTIFYLMDGSVLGDLPTLAVIGKDQNAETVLVTAKQSDGGYVIQRGIEGLPRAWDKNTEVARNFTNYDYQQLIDNINALNDDKVGKVEGKGLSTKDYTAAEQTKLKDIEENATKTEIINDLTSGGTTKALSAEQGKELKRQIDTQAKELKTSIDAKVETVEGKGLSTNDFTNAIKDKVDGIEDEANKTTIINDLTTGGVDKALSAEQGKVLFQNVDDGKLQIANAIIDKGQSGVSNSSSFQELATGIKNIKTGYGVGDIIKPADVKVLSRTEEKAPSKVWGFTGHTGIVRAVVVDNSGNVYSGGDDKKIIKISPSGSKVWEFTGNTDAIYGLAVDSKGNICSSSENGRLMKISPNKQKIWEFTGLNNRIPSVVVDSKDYIYACDVNKIVKISPTGSKVWEFTGLSDGVYTLATDSKDYIYAGSGDKKTTKISPTGSKVWEFTGHTFYVNAITVDSKGNIYAADRNKIVKISPQRQKVWEFAVNGSFGAAITVDNEDNIYFADSDAKITKISPTGSKIWESKEHIYSLNAVAVDDNNNVYTGSNDKTVIKIHQNIKKIPIGYEVLR